MAEPQEKSAYQKYREEREAARKAAKGQIETPPSAYSEYKSKREQERAGAPATGKQAALDARNARISERQDLTGKAQKAIRDVQDIQRKRRVEPVAAAADIAAAEAKEKARAESPFYDRTDLMAFKDAARQQVYDQANVVSPSDAFTGRSANALALGIPGIVNKDFRGQLAQAGVDQPGAAIAGDLLGFLAPGAAGWSAAARGVNALARPFIPRGADAASRTVRYGAPLAGQISGAALTNAGYRAAVDEPIRAETAGEDLTLGGMAAAAKRGLEDPLNLIPLGLSGTNRIWNQLTSGIATPSARAAEMANLYGVGPRQTAASQGIVQTTQELGGQLQGADIRGLTNIENALRFALRDNRNIPDVNARIATGFQRIRESLPLEDDPTLNLARLIEREFAPDAPQTRDIIRNFLRGVGLNSPGGGQIVGDAANQMRGQQADVLRTELESSFGAQPKTEANAAMQQSLDQFSAAYNTVLGAAPRQGPQVDRARALLAREPQSAAILDDIAQSQNLTAEQFIERNPLQALHEVQSELATQARALAARGDAGAGPLEITVRNMQRPLRDAVPGYGDLQGLWRQWTQARERMGYVRGAESGTRGELSTVPGFGDKIFGPGGIAKSEMGTQTAADVYLQMDDLSQRAAGLSVRDVINDELRKGKAAGLEERYQTAANMRRVATEGGLDALRRVFGEAGDRVARRIEQFMDANEFARNIDPEFNSATMNKAQAMQTGAQPFAGPMGQAADSASSALSQSAITDAALMLGGASTAPIVTAMRGLPVIGQMFRPGQRSQRNIAETLLRRGEIGSQVPPRPGGPAPITPIDPAMVPGARPPPGGPPSGGPPPAGGPPPQAPRTVGVAPAAAGAGAPAMAAPAGAPAAERATNNKLGTRAADATAIGILATGGPTAQADTGDPQQRLEELSQRESAAQQLITEYDQGLKDFQSLSVTEKQIFLRDNGFTGEGGAILKDDGRTGGNTTYAINNYVQKIQEAKAAAQAERELTLNQINQVRVGMAERQENPPNPLFDKAAELATYGAMIYGAHRLRGAATKGSQKAARLVADDANALLTRLPVPPQAPRRTLSSRVPVLGSKEAARIKTATNAANKAAHATEERLAGRDIPPISSNPTSENGLPIRTANLQEFDRRQAAGDFGPAGPIGRLMEPINSRIRAVDVGIIGAGAADAHIMQGMLDKTRADIDAEEARLEKARLAADSDLIRASNDRLEQLRKAETVQTILQRVGVGLMIGGTVSLAHGRYSRPQPRFEAANRERELIRLAQTPTPPPPNALAPPIPPKKPRTVGTQKPKPKPPVSFTRGRPPKAENDND
jgi:hypothetical protein